MARDHARDNRETAGFWRQYEQHRRHLMKILMRAAHAGCRSLLIAGAGNCNDLDLAELIAHFEAITLLDPDRDALVSGLERQHCARAVDLECQSIETFAAGASGAHGDLVVSACVLSQLLIEVGRQDQNAARTIVQQHTAALAKLARREVLIVTDCAAVARGNRVELPEATVFEKITWIDQNASFFDHLKPHTLLRAIRSPEIALVFTPPEMSGIWLWEQGSACLATLAIGLCRR
jgi:hypothetical protein